MKNDRAVTIQLNTFALENASNLAFDLFDQQGWPLGELSAEQLAERIIRRYLEMVGYSEEEA